MKVSSRVRNVALAAGIAVGGISAVVVGTSASAPTASAASSQRCHFTNAQPEIKYGSRGAAVMQAQCELNFAWVYQFHHGGLAEDGIFGAQTRAATKAFQGCAGIAQDGIIGPRTWSWLNLWAHTSGCFYQATLPQGAR